MAYLEISNKQVWKILEDEINESYSNEEINKLMKFTMKIMKEWYNDDNYNLNYGILVKMKKMCEKMIKDYED